MKLLSAFGVVAIVACCCGAGGDLMAACDGGDGESCEALGEQYDDGTDGMPVDDVQALARY